LGLVAGIHWQQDLYRQDAAAVRAAAGPVMNEGLVVKLTCC